MRNKRQLGILAAAFVILAALYFVSADRNRSDSLSQRSLATGVSPDQIAKIAIKEGDNEIRLEISSDRWIIPARENYAAATDKIRSLLLRLLSLRVSQAIADSEAHHTKFGVSDAAVQSGQMRISFQDESGKELAGYYLGETRRVRAIDPTRVGGGGQYVRKAGDNTVFLIPETISFPVDPAQWVKPELLAISEERVIRVRQISLTPEESIDFVIERAAPGSREYRFEDGSEADLATAGPVAAGLENLRIEDVMSLSKAAELPAFDRRTVFELENGQRITVDTTSLDERLYGKFRVEFDPILVEETQERYHQANELRAAASKVSSDEVDSKTGADTDNSEEGEGSTENAPLPPLTPPQAATVEQTELLNRSLEPWVFQLPSFHTERFRKSKADLVPHS